MYLPDTDDHVFTVDDAPPPSGGPAMAMVVADEHSVVLMYAIADAYCFNPGSEAVPLVALCRFRGVRASYLGTPNDEALTSHPLYEQGLSCYGVFRVDPSPWIRELERFWNKSPARPTHPRPGTHFIVTMQDGTFECVAHDVSFEVLEGRPAEVAAGALDRLSGP